MASKILVIDNYDSFVFNLVHYLKDLGCDVTVKRNDKVDLSEIEEYDKVLLSPGPGIPEEAGRMGEIIRRYAGKKPILGICLGHQAIAEVFGGKLINLDDVFHGVATKVERTNIEDPIYKDVPRVFNVGRYHSWLVNFADLPQEFEITATDKNGQIMSIRHKEYDLKGIQYHPESILTEHGMKIMENWVNS